MAATARRNFGWPCYEGAALSPGTRAPAEPLHEPLQQPGSVTFPVFTYEHGTPITPGENCATNTGSSISGLTFYEGGNFPSQYGRAVLRRLLAAAASG